MTNAPLSGIRVLEISGLGPAPCTGMMLADMGAEVILVERKTDNSNAAQIGIAGGASIYNRGKQSIAIDLKQPQGIELILKLVKDSDVLIEGFRPGVMERLGLGPDVCMEHNEKLIYGRMTGWGQYGPLSKAAGHDPNYIGVSGAQWFGGRDGRGPTAPLTLVGDLGGGTMMLAWGILCAYIDVQRTGKGKVIDAAISDGSAYLSSLLWAMYSSGQLTDKLGETWVDGGAPWNDTYVCADGQYVNVCALEPQFYAEFMHLMELAEHPLFLDQWNKSLWPEAKLELATLFSSKTREQWCERLEGSDACFSPVLNFKDAPLHPHNIARKTFYELDGVMQPSAAPKISGYEAKQSKPPMSGEQTVDIVVQLGMSEAEIASLQERGVI